MLSDLELEYTPNDITSDQFMSEVPLDLIKENIKYQFIDPLEYRKKDHISTFISIYEYSVDNADAYENEDMDDFTSLRDDFISFMLNMFEKYLNIGFVDFWDKSIKDQHNLIHYVYRFFLMNIRKNFIHYIMSCIDDDRSSYDIDEKKDVTTLSFKREVTDPVDIYILSNLHSIITDILKREIDVDDFLNRCDDCLETNFVKDKFDSLDITGNFIDKYVEMVDNDFIANIETKIRNKILKKYRKIKKTDQAVDIEDEESEE